MRYLNAFLERDRPTMDQMVEAMSGVPGESQLLFFEAQAAAAGGRLEEAQRFNRRAVEVAKSHGFNERAADLAAWAGGWEALWGRLDEAVEISNRALESSLSRGSLMLSAINFARAGEIGQAGALIAEIEGRVPASDTEMHSVVIPIVQAMLLLHQGNPEEAIERLEIARVYERSYPDVLFLRGVVYLDLDRPKEARDELEKILDLRGVEPTNSLHTLVHLEIGRASWQLGEISTSRRHYEAFFDLLSQADPELPVVRAARDGYAKLDLASN